MPPPSASSAPRAGRVYGLHVLPNIASTLIVSMTITFPETILLESGLSFLGLGVQPPLTSLGNMVGYGREYLTRAPWIMLFPGRGDRADDAVDQHHRRLAARQARSDAALVMLGARHSVALMSSGPPASGRLMIMSGKMPRSGRA